MSSQDKFGLLAEALKDRDIKGSLFDPRRSKQNKQKRYLHLMRGINMLSHSTSELLIACERKFSVKKLLQNKELIDDDLVTLEGNIDFAFGHAVETGVQAALLSHSADKIFFDMFLAWDLQLMQQHPKGYAKTFTDACIAIDQFIYIKNQLMQGWEIAMFKNKPAIELAMIIDLENGYYFVGHSDIILFHPERRKYKVLEIKTTGAKNLQPALYKNSGQGTGYSIFVDQVAKSLDLSATFEVTYLVFPIWAGYWQQFDFIKARSDRAAWINTILLDIQRVNTSRTLNFWPKRGQNCMDWGRPCEFIDNCDLPSTSFNQDGKYAVITEKELGEHEFDFRFKLSEIIETQKELIK